MKSHKKKKSKTDLEIQAETAEDNSRAVPFGALAELTSSEVIAQVKMGMSRIEPLDHEAEFGEEEAA